MLPYDYHTLPPLALMDLLSQHCLDIPLDHSLTGLLWSAPHAPPPRAFRTAGTPDHPALAAILARVDAGDFGSVDEAQARANRAALEVRPGNTTAKISQAVAWGRYPEAGIEIALICQSHRRDCFAIAIPKEP
jgi:hypothetical protein